MEEIIYNEIPSLDLADFIGDDSSKRKRFSADLGIAYTSIGFVAIQNHFLTGAIQKELYAVIRQFFALPDSVKQQYEVSAGRRGYTGKGKEHAKGRSTGDLKEFYHVGQELPASDLEQLSYPENVWPAEVPEFRRVTVEAFQALEKTGIYMLRAIALFLDLEETYFDDKVKQGNSILRPLHYFPITDPDSIAPDAVRAAEHGDINLITLLMGASADGLQVLRRDGQWIPVKAQPDQLVVNVGDMLERHTNKKLKSTIHRVVNPPREEMDKPRYSIPFFMQPQSGMNLACLENCVDEDHPKLFEDTTAGSFLDERLADIGFKK